MRPLSTAAGALLRTLRKQRGLTLQAAAPRVGISIASLSRKERGVDGMDRAFLRRAAAGFALSPWEAYRLWATAGYAPESAVTTALPADLRTFAHEMLAALPYPALIMDNLGYFKAWNRPNEYFWQPSAAPGGRPHAVRDIFSQRVRNHLGGEWEATARRGIEAFYAQTLTNAEEPAIAALLDQLHAELGPEFARFWAEARRNAHDPPAALDAGLFGRLRMQGVDLEYVVAVTAFAEPTPTTLAIYLPLGAQSAAFYAALYDRIQDKGDAVYFAADV